jgi:uncharacterized surface protein with fasciclin (FAS1) repeats
MKPLYLCLSVVGLSSLALGLVPNAETADVKAAPAPTPNWRGQTLAEFGSDENARFGWEVVNDGVMGGLSKGDIEFSDEEVMRFSGTLSLKNNGGFSTVRSREVNFDLSNDEGLLLRVRGDGRKYQARLASDATFRGMEVSFSAEFVTPKGEWVQVKLPFSSFEGSFRGMELPDVKLDLSQIRRIGLLLGDKVEGKFDIEVDWIRTYGKGKGAASLTGGERKAEGSGIVGAVVGDSRFSTLATALTAAELLKVLEGEGPFTVFAPTDEAFAKLPKKVLADLLKKENKEQLVNILTYHVSVGKSRLSDVLTAGEVKTLQGESFDIAFRRGAVAVGQAALIDADIECSNGIVHVIDTVLLPPKPEKPAPATILTTAESAGQFSTLLAAVDAAELSAILGGEGPFTVFAPTDAAFAALPEGTLASLLKKENRKDLVSVLTYHVVAGRVKAGEALSAGTATTLQGESLRFAVKDGRLLVNDAPLMSVDVDGGNGVIHIIDQVLLPPKGESKVKDQTSRADDSNAFESIATAIEKGVPLYNYGDPAACADVYEACIENLAADDEVASHVQRMLQAVMSRGMQHDNDIERAWLYRHTLDGMMIYLDRSKRQTAE